MALQAKQDGKRMWAIHSVDWEDTKFEEWIFGISKETGDWGTAIALA